MYQDRLVVSRRGSPLVLVPRVWAGMPDCPASACHSSTSGSSIWAPACAPHRGEISAAGGCHVGGSTLALAGNLACRTGSPALAWAETLATVTPVLLAPGQQRPGDRQIRDALYCWAFRDRDNPPGEIAEVLHWVADHARPLADLADRDLMLDVLDAISSKLDGKPAAANTVARKRAVLSNVLDYGVGRGLTANPSQRRRRYGLRRRPPRAWSTRGWSSTGVRPMSS
jgi:hypothetical protein